LVLLESIQLVGYYGGDFKKFRPKVAWYMEFWIIFNVIENTKKIPNSNLISWVVISHLGQQQKPHCVDYNEWYLVDYVLKGLYKIYIFWLTFEFTL
jgi:hypothetical protein